MKKSCIFLLFLIQFIIPHASGKQQKIIDNDSLLTYYLQNNPPYVDSSGDAIMLLKAEKIEITDDIYLNNVKGFNFTEEKCFKILKKDALSLATFSIPTSENFTANHINIYVCSFEDGKLVKERITKSDAIKEVLVEGVKLYKFNIPELKIGKILYYSVSYQSEIQHIFTYNYIPIRHVFQDQYPVVESSFDLDITNDAAYKVYASNLHFDTITAPSDNRNGNTVCITPLKKSKDFQWKTHNLDPIKKESYVNNFSHKSGAIELIYDNGITNKYTNFLNATWQEALPLSEFQFFSPEAYNDMSLAMTKYWQDSIKGSPSFIKKIDSFKNNKNHTAGDSLAFATEIYHFVRDSIKTVYNNNRISDARGYTFAIKYKKGTVTEKNALLTFLLTRAGFISRNIILSTDQKLDINNFDPNAIDYLISVLIIGKDYYFLDPGFRFLPFGKLAPKCYNGTAIVLNNKYAPIEILPQAYKDKWTMSYVLTPKDSSDDYAVKVEERYGKESAAMMREFLKDDSTESKDYLKNLTKEMKYNVSIVDWSIKNENLIDSQLIINYNLNLQLETSGTFMYFNPFMKKVQTTNPFKDVERKYPIEFGLKPGMQYLFTMKLPPNTTLEEFPENKVLNFKDGTSLSYQQTSTFDEAKNTIYLSYNFKSSACEFPVSDYAALRNFYDQIITEQAKQIVLKKK